VPERRGDRSREVREELQVRGRERRCSDAPQVQETDDNRAWNVESVTVYEQLTSA
jgi:hypothetical protein